MLSNYFAELFFPLYSPSKQESLQPQLSTMRALFYFIVTGLGCRVTRAEAVPGGSIAPAAAGERPGQCSAVASWHLRLSPRLLGLNSAMRICIHFSEKDDDSLVFLHAAKAYKTLKIPNKINLFFFFKMSISYFKLVTFSAQLLWLGAQQDPRS